MEKSDSSIFSGTFTQLLAALSGTLFAISDGMSYGWTAPIIPYLISNSSHLATTKYEAEWLETDLMLGSFCGLPTTIYLVDKIGRKRSLLLATCCSLFGWIVIAVANKMVYIHVVRFLFGMSANMSFVAAPMYIAEIADSKIRGLLSSIVYLMMLVGFVIVYSVGPFLPFYVTSVVGCIVLIIELSIFSFMPESPYYLLFKNKPELARRSLEYFRPNCNVTIELEDITEAIERQKTERGRIMDIILVKSNRKAIIIMTILNGGQHLVAISVILMNLHMILESAGSIYMDSSHAAILFSVIMVISAQIAALQVDKYGRKALLLISTVLTGFCLLAIAIYFHLKIAGYDVRGVSWIPIVAVMVYAATFKLGLGIVPIVITAEIFPAKMKAIGMTVSDAMYVIGAIISVQLYTWLVESNGIHAPFYLFTVSSFLIATFILLYLPETKGKTLEEIQFLMKGEKYIPANMDSLLSEKS
uniref:Putative sugar transporter 1 n=1 Tax=Phaedon cochleariae TaxID=80249 RepID=W0FQS5_PHACE|nr:putative sugar transporter 1 [Phaedon cochleariae]